jgi:membrane protein involved in colicin uptake
MAERQETSVMASIQDILRDAQLREEQEKVDAQRRAQAEEQARLDAIRKQQEDEERRIRDEEEERQRRAYEEQRKAAELNALQEATVQRARMEAEAQARLAEMAARQEHERQLAALKQDKHKKRLVFGLVGGGIVFVLAVSIGGWQLYSTSQKNKELQAQIAADEAQKVQLDKEKRDIQSKLDQTTDPEQIAQLKAQLKERNDKIDDLNKDLSSKGKATGPTYGVGGKGPSGPAATGGGGSKPPCACAAGDPLCSCL